MTGWELNLLTGYGYIKNISALSQDRIKRSVPTRVTRCFIFQTIIVRHIEFIWTKTAAILISMSGISPKAHATLAQNGLNSPPVSTRAKCSIRYERYFQKAYQALIHLTNHNSLYFKNYGLIMPDVLRPGETPDENRQTRWKQMRHSTNRCHGPTWSLYLSYPSPCKTNTAQ